MSESGPARNRLAHESSPYLLLHQSNPVDWYPWGEEALARARDEDRPIFLSVGYSTCYWCHVMERESFSDPAMAELMNASFVNVKLDREERPDLDEIYMTATQVLTGHGGWPNSVFLTPELKPFFAGTYFPPDDRRGMPGFRRVLHSMVEAWQSRRSEVMQQAESVAEALRRYLEERAGVSAGLPSPEVARTSLTTLERRFDPRWGGFSEAPKFPTPSNLMLLEDFVDGGEGEKEAGSARAAEMLTATLDQMARGGIYDRLGGGFHRYATDGEWKIPHFEKMLYDNGLLLELYAGEWARGGDPEMARIVRETVAFLDREMSHDSGAYFSALDAETEGEEGAFYVWKAAELRAVLGDEDFGFLAPLYGFDVPPFFEDLHYVLRLPAPLAEQASRRRLGLDALVSQVEPLRQRLFEARAQRQAPLTDRKVMADWNGMAIAGVAEAGRLLPEPQMVERAARAADAVLEALRPEGELLHVRRGERPPVAAFLSDYVFLVRGLLALERASGESRWLELAAGLTREQIERLEDPSGGFFVAAASDEVLFRSKEAFDGAVPAANAVAVLNLLELAERTGELSWSDVAHRTLAAFGSLVDKLPDGARTMALATRRYARLVGVEEAADLDEPAAVGTAEPTPVSIEAHWHGEADAEGWCDVEVELRIEEGWHLYAHRAQGLPGVGVAAAVGELRDVDYPPGLDDHLELDGVSVPVYLGRTILRGRALPQGGELTLEVSYQACDDRRCLAPRTEVVKLQGIRR
jgi:uncharacterized protein YyaL (SSP411 family)